MDKKTILEKSRIENKNIDLVEKNAYKSAALTGTIVGWCAIALVLLLTGFINHRTNYGALVIFFAIESGIFITKYLKLRKLHELIVSVIYVIASISAFVFFILQLLGVII